jgi:hypothetical protein
MTCVWTGFLLGRAEEIVPCQCLGQILEQVMAINNQGLWYKVRTKKKLCFATLNAAIHAQQVS